MEANLIIKAADLTPDFADGLCKVFSKNAILTIKVEYNLNGDESSQPKKRGPKPKVAGSVAPASVAPTGKKRGRKPGPKPALNTANSELPKKRGPKPKFPVA